MKIFVLGKRYSGKSPFAIEVAAALGWQHIEALNWLRSHFESSEFAHMLLDAEMMNQIVLNELEHNPRACADYVRSKLHTRRTAVIDGLFAFDDFAEFFNPEKDVVVDMKHTNSRIEPTSYERDLDTIRRHVRQCAADGQLDSGRFFRYRFPEFRRAAGVPDKVTRTEKGSLSCSSLSAAINHFVAEMKVTGLAR